MLQTRSSPTLIVLWVDQGLPTAVGTMSCNKNAKVPLRDNASRGVLALSLRFVCRSFEGGLRRGHPGAGGRLPSPLVRHLPFGEFVAGERGLVRN